MQEASQPPLVEPLRSGGLADSVYETALRNPGIAQLAARAPGDNGWQEITAAEFKDQVLALAKGLLAEGVRAGDRVALMSRTRWESTLFVFALWSAGAVVVPLYPTSSTDQLRWSLVSSGARAVVVENEDHAMTLGSVCGDLPQLHHVWQLDAGCVGTLTEAGGRIADDRVRQRRLAVTPEATAAHVYTSGTTGRARACVISHANLAAECDTLLAGWRCLMAPPGTQPSILGFLPAGHIYGLMVTVMCVRGGILLGHQPDLSPAGLLPALASFRPTCVMAVPYIFEKFFDRARLTALADGKGPVFDAAMGFAENYALALQRKKSGAGRGPGPRMRARHALYEVTVYRRLRQVLGGRVRNAVSSGSPLSRRLGLMFAGAGITIYEGYGLTETTGAVTGQPPGNPRYGTVGRPLPGSSVSIAADGEVRVSGDVVFRGYLDDEKATAECLQDGWLATGDVGYLDDGFLVITGRKKDVLITSGGKSVPLLVLEERLRAHPLISQALIVGDNRPFVAALIALDPEALRHWHAYRMPGQGDGTAEEDLEREIQRAIGAANAVVSKAESIRAFRLVPREFSVADGLMTPSLKLRRPAIERAYAKEIDDLYAR